MLIDLPTHNTDNKPARIKKIQNLAYLKKKKKKTKKKKDRTSGLPVPGLDLQKPNKLLVKNLDL